jgi:hypothetical protein
VEVDEGRRLAEGLVKWLTGGDRMPGGEVRRVKGSLRASVRPVALEALFLDVAAGAGLRRTARQLRVP